MATTNYQRIADEVIKAIEEKLKMVQEHEAILRGKEDRPGMISTVSDLKNTCTKITTTVYGNGKPGLVHDVDELKRCREDTITWKWVIDKLITPLLVALILYLFKEYGG